MKPEEAIPLLQRGLVGEIYDQKGFLTALGYEALDAIDSSNCKTLVQKQHGEWIDYQDAKYSYLANCSKCGYQMDTHEEHGYFNFCPYCGADMRTQNDRSWDTSERGVSGSVKNSIAQEEGEAE